MQNNPVIVDIVRSPMGRGKAGGLLSEVHPVDLLSQTLVGLLKRNPALDPGLVGDVIVGCVSQAGEQGFPPGRSAWLGAGLPIHVPSTTVDRRCGSSQQALHFAAQVIASGDHEIVLAGGIESMSRVPMGSARLGQDVFGPAYRARFPIDVGQGVAAELVAARWNIGRDEMDAYAASSHDRAEATRKAGGLANEIVAIDTPAGPVHEDETIRPGTTPESLSGLRTVFMDDAIGRQFPQINWSVTAGNSSQITDGAAMALIMSEAAATRLGLRPRARIVACDVIADDPLLMLTAPIPATQRVLRKAGLAVSDIDQFEVNEAFASVPLAWQRELHADPAKLNPRGGAIALGHPLGASGTRLMASLLNGLEETGGRYGLQTMCEAGGQANATIIERL
ncbi:thiolase family protein [Novosphingobium colocasiae]|uniref:Acetyl-CoA acyltransferase n=1 Tax=Novosphingobium colocasiae TaxID=1256513 RepID=A0A918UKN3_9SPHN|nr:thiolase family protein [Novosphingobium colocasiae]GGZ17263.1 acetyl-CoA acyltransferase [Novosphingobium colocasiae]